MPFGLIEWAAIAAIVSAMSDVISTGKDTFQNFYQNRINAPDAEQRGVLLKQALSTYSDEEVEAIGNRIKSCRLRFISEGSGAQRRSCLCSVLKDVKDGNGGSIPVSDWENIYSTLGCSSI